jgi:hypothetical protein
MFGFKQHKNIQKTYNVMDLSANKCYKFTNIFILLFHIKNYK